MNVISSKAFEFAECQVVAFTTALQLPTTAVLGALLAVEGVTFDGDPIILPPSMGSEVPHIVLTSKDGRHRIQAGQARLDVFRNLVPGEPIPSLETAVLSAFPLIEAYQLSSRATFKRLAVLTKRTVVVEDPAKALASHFCQQRWLDGPLNRPREFELHAHKMFTLPGSVEVNSWFRCKTAILSLPGDPRAIVAEQDLNTLSEREQEFDLPSVRDFLNTTVPAFDEILEKYFPSA